MKRKLKLKFENNDLVTHFKFATKSTFKLFLLIFASIITFGVFYLISYWFNFFIWIYSEEDDENKSGYVIVRTVNK